MAGARSDDPAAVAALRRRVEELETQRREQRPLTERVERQMAAERQAAEHVKVTEIEAEAQRRAAEERAAQIERERKCLAGELSERDAKLAAVRAAPFWRREELLCELDAAKGLPRLSQPCDTRGNGFRRLTGVCGSP